MDSTGYIVLMDDGFDVLVFDLDRNAIEGELEVLYDAHYEELEQYTNHRKLFLVSGGRITLSPGPGGLMIAGASFCH